MSALAQERLLGVHACSYVYTNVRQRSRFFGVRSCGRMRRRRRLGRSGGGRSVMPALRRTCRPQPCAQRHAVNTWGWRALSFGGATASESKPSVGFGACPFWIPSERPGAYPADVSLGARFCPEHLARSLPPVPWRSRSPRPALSCPAALIAHPPLHLAPVSRPPPGHRPLSAPKKLGGGKARRPLADARGGDYAAGIVSSGLAIILGLPIGEWREVLSSPVRVHGTCSSFATRIVQRILGRSAK